MKRYKSFIGTVALSAAIAGMYLQSAEASSPAPWSNRILSQFQTQAGGFSSRQLSKAPFGMLPPGVTVGNPANELDFVGNLHNSMLDTIILNKDSLGSNKNSWVLNSYKVIAENSCGTQAILLAEFTGMTPGTMPDDCSPTVTEIEFLEDLYSMQDSAVAMGFPSFIASVKQLEASICATPMSSRAKISLLSATSIARYSSAYWLNQTLLPGGSLWATPPFGGPEALSAFSWGDFGKVDVATGVGAGVAVGIYSLAAGPPGWLIGGATILGSAIGGSVTNAILQLW
jgi:hypothetical protein